MLGPPFPSSDSKNKPRNGYRAHTLFIWIENTQINFAPSVSYYIIRKVSRDGFHPYEGPSCELAKIPGGKVYTNILEAREHANRLAKVNPAGFTVVEITQLQKEKLDMREEYKE